MPIRSLHPNQQQILSALQSAMRILRTSDSLTIVGSLGRFLAGQTQRVGDIDVLIDAPLCERYWEFIEILGLHGITSVFDVFDRPKFPWKPCRQQTAHAKALTVDCCANVLMSYGMKHANLDICFKASDLDAIPHSSQWVRLLNPDELRDWDESTRAKAISRDHQEFINELKRAEKDPQNRRFHDQLGLWYDS